MSYKRFSEQEKLEITEKYLSGQYSCERLGREYNSCGTSVRNLFKKTGIVVKNNQREIQRRYTLNNNFFDKIDTEEKAYFLGLLYADGYNCEEWGTVQISLQEEDKHILEKFKEVIKGNMPLIFYEKTSKNKNWKNMYRLTICSKTFTERLKLLGCMQAKSMIVEFPNEKQVPSYLLNHFIRGYFDGDGSFNFYISKFGKLDYNFCITSSDKFCLGMSHYINMAVGIDSKVYIKNKKISLVTSDLKISSYSEMLKCLDWMYNEATIYYPITKR